MFAKQKHNIDVITFLTSYAVKALYVCTLLAVCNTEPLKTVNLLLFPNPLMGYGAHPVRQFTYVFSLYQLAAV